jgi:hypothetical protein
MNRLVLRAAIAAALGMGAALAHADSFTYHGTLQDAGRPANGNYDIQLTLYSKQSGGTVLAGPVTLSRVQVANGNFSTVVDFGPMTSMTSQGWVDVKVSPAGNNAFVSLDNRSPVAPEGGCPGSWTLDGNAAIPAGSYLGTSDNTEVDIRANGSAVAWFMPTGSTALSDPYSVNGSFSTGIGFNAGTNFSGSTVIGGYQDVFGNAVHDSNTNQFIVTAEHGVGINTSSTPDGFAGLNDELTIAPSSSLPASNTDITLETPATSSSYAGFNIQADPTGYFYIMGLYNTGAGLRYDPLMYFNFFSGGQGADITFNGTLQNGALTVGDATHEGGGAYLSSGGVWTNASSRTFKDDFGSVDVGAVLEKLVSVPVQTWFYKQSHGEGRHIGPFAEDFAAAFGYGKDDQHIATVDESGVTIAAIQGLNQKVESDNAALKHENAELKTKLDALSARMDQLESHKGE